MKLRLINWLLLLFFCVVFGTLGLSLLYVRLTSPLNGVSF